MTTQQEIAKATQWKCAGCGIVSPNKMRSCDCVTAVLFRIEDGSIQHAVKIDHASHSVYRAMIAAGTEPDTKLEEAQLRITNLEADVEYLRKEITKGDVRIEQLERELAEEKQLVAKGVIAVEKMIEDWKRMREALRQVTQFAGQLDLVKDGNLQTAVAIARAALEEI